MSRYIITTFPENCSFCRRCQLGCSNAYLRNFDIDSANIKIEVKGAECSISFGDQCRECGICTDFCFFGAITKSEKEVTC